MPAQAQQPQQHIAVASAALAQLTSREASYVQLVLSGLPKKHAYLKAFPNASAKTADSNAYQLAAKPNVILALEMGRRAGLAAAVRDRENWLELVQQREAQSAASQQFTASARFLEIEGKAQGWLQNGQEGDKVGLAPNEILLSIRANIGASIADQIASAIGFGDLGTNAGPVIEGEARPADLVDADTGEKE